MRFARNYEDSLMIPSLGLGIELPIREGNALATGNGRASGLKMAQWLFLAPIPLSSL